MVLQCGAGDGVSNRQHQQRADYESIDSSFCGLLGGHPEAGAYVDAFDFLGFDRITRDFGAVAAQFDVSTFRLSRGTVNSY